MARTGTILLLLLMLFPCFVSGQDKDSVWYRDRANELARSGVILNREGKYIESLDSFKLVLQYRKKGYGEEHYMLGAAYSAIGIGYFNLGQNKSALKYYDLAEKSYLLRNEPYLTSLGRLYRNIGNVYRSQLDYQAALQYFEQSLDIFKNQQTVDLFDISDAYYAIADIYYLMNNHQNALKILLENYEQTDDYNQIFFSELLGIVYQRIDQYDKADYYYRNTIQLAINYFGNDHMQVAIEFMKYAEFLSEIQNFEKGMQVLEQAFDIITKYENKKGSQLAEYYEYKGDLIKSRPVASQDIGTFKQQKKKNLNEALSLYKESLFALYTGEGEVEIEELRIDNCLSFTDCTILLKTTADTYNEMALLDKEEKNIDYLRSLEEALRYYKVISKLIQRARMEISSDESKVLLAELEYETFTKTIETAYFVYELNREEEYLELAFNNSEQIKSSAVFDKISSDLAQENSLIPDSLIELENNLNNTVSIYNEKIFEESSEENPDSALIQEYNNLIFEASRQRDELTRFIEENYSDYYNLKYSNNLLTISEIQQRLHKKEAVIEYVLDEKDSVSQLYAFIITKNEESFHKTTLTDQQIKSMEYMFNFMTSPNYLFTQNEDSKQFCESSNNMYSLLIQPYNNAVRNKNLTIVPDNKLNYIAFDGLLKTLPDTSNLIDFSKLDYLVKDFNVNYANSVNILMQNRNSKRNLRNKVLAFAPEYNSEEFELSNISYILSPLPGVQKEVDAISKTLSTDVFRDTMATEETFREKSPYYDILHLAMHAYINDSLPAFSRLAFSPEKEETELNRDGWLNTADIYNLDLQQVRLTVLSACNTGVGKMQKGEGLMSLARGFFYAGCPSIIMSLWEVEDNAGTEIMTSFYDNLKSGKTTDEALRMAKIKYLEESNSRLAHPHYWMSFKSIGDNSPIYTSNDIYFFALLIVLVIAFSIDQGVRMKKARRKRQAS